MPYIDIEEYKKQVKSGKPPEEPILRKQFTIGEIKGIEETKDGLKVPFVISTDSVDRDNDSISIDGWKLNNFKKNPVVLWVHDSRQPPVGKATSTIIEDSKLKSTAIFATQDLYPFGYMIGQMYSKGFLHAVSVGFDPIKYSWVEDKDRPWGIDFEEQELLEYSCCPVPANPEALVDAKSAGIELDPMLDWVERVLDEGILIPKARAEKIFKILSTKSTILIPKQQDKREEKNPLSLYEKQIQINLNGGI